MRSDKVKTFMQLAGQKIGDTPHHGSLAERRLGAQLLLSEVLEYVIHGLGIVPHINGQPVFDPEDVTYEPGDEAPNLLDMVDGLSDVAYTMYWNANAFGLPLEEAFDIVCDNNLEKFVRLDDWIRGEGSLDRTDWGCGCGVQWPAEVVRVDVVCVAGVFYAVGKDLRGKVRKPSSYSPVNLQVVLEGASYA